MLQIIDMAINKKGKYIRMAPDVEELVMILAEKKNKSQTEVIEIAIRNEAKKDKITKKDILEFKESSNKE